MDRALALAERGWGRVHPNPLVGAVVVKAGRIVGEGWHREFGGLHAEVEALNAAGEQARAGTLYVTLEPCCHHGKTPPCTNAILGAGIKRVVYGASDPHPQAGGGAQVLRTAGVAVEGDVAVREVRVQNASFFHVLEQQQCYLALKLAFSLDARLSARAGERTPITGEESAREVHRLRSGFDAILIGGNTAEIDDPLLTVRYAPAPVRPPIRVVLDTRARLRVDSALVRSILDAPLWLLCGYDAAGDKVGALEQAGVRVFRLPVRGVRIDLTAALHALYTAGVRSVLCEGGGELAAGLLEQDLVQRIYAFIAPRLLGPAGVPAFPFSNAVPADAWQVARIAQFGSDALLMLERTGSGAS